VVGLFVCLLVTFVSPAKTAELIEMPFGMKMRVDAKNHVLYGGPDSPWKEALLRGVRMRGSKGGTRRAPPLIFGREIIILQRDAMLARYMLSLSVCQSDRLTVCLSV